MIPLSVMRRLNNALPDMRRAKMPRPASVWFHNKATYDCHKCGAPMERLDAHGWHWGCANCKVSFPLYVLEPSKKVELPVEGRSFMSKIKDAFMGR
jgi:ribosomal protein L37AE/L43A